VASSVRSVTASSVPSGDQFGLKPGAR
jgi:hypothetical protein